MISKHILQITFLNKVECLCIHLFIYLFYFQFNKLATIVEGDSKAPISIATTSKFNGFMYFCLMWKILLVAQSWMFSSIAI